MHSSSGTKVGKKKKKGKEFAEDEK